MTLPFKYPSNAKLIPLSSIIRESRERKDYGNLQELADSLVEHGLTHPPTVWHDVINDTYTLLAGGRRTASMELLGCEFIPCSVRDEPLEDYQLIEIELIENTDRKSFTWQEEVALINKAHTLYQAKARNDKTKWGTRLTGRLLKRSTAHISHALILFAAIKQGNEEVAKAESVAEAYRILLKQKEDEANQLGATRLRSTLVPSTPVPSILHKPGPQTVMSSSVRNAASIDDVFDLTKDLDGLLPPNPSTPQGVSNFFNGMKEFPLSEWYHNVDAYDFMDAMPSDSFNGHIITDPPYGIDLTDGFVQDKNEIAEEHDREENIANFPRMIESFYRILAPDSYCILFYDYEHYETLVQLAKSVGFRHQIHPFIWHKTHTCKNQAPLQNFTKNHEPALVLKKGSPSLTSAGLPSLVSANGQLERHLYTNPFAKPFNAWKPLIEAVTHPGQTIFDPFAGQGSCPRACINLNTPFLACEKVVNHYNRGVVNVRDLINELTQNKATFK